MEKIEIILNWYNINFTVDKIIKIWYIYCSSIGYNVHNAHFFFQYNVHRKIFIYIILEMSNTHVTVITIWMVYIYEETPYNNLFLEFTKYKLFDKTWLTVQVIIILLSCKASIILEFHYHHYDYFCMVDLS